MKPDYKRLGIIGGIGAGSLSLTIIAIRAIFKSQRQIPQSGDVVEQGRSDSSENDKKSFDREGYDNEGYNRSGYDKNGFDREGYDRRGFGIDGFNRDGIDGVGLTRDTYSLLLNKLLRRWKKAYEQMEAGEFEYSLYDARLVMEETLRLIVFHNLGRKSSDNSTLSLLRYCSRRKILDPDMVDRLHDVRKAGNINNHDLLSDNSISQNKIYFILMQVRDLITEARVLLTEGGSNGL